MTVKVSVKDVSKQYDLYKNKSDRIKAIFNKNKKPQEFWALRHVSFDVHEGETVGLIGVNGSGKSTVSSIIAGIAPLTKGELKVNGEVSMIAIGAGLKGPLTGLENIRMKCLMLGYSMKKINELMPEIIEFSDLGDFIHQPVKSYSSGMKSRLGFAIAVHIDPDVLVIDEALSVGDKTFYQKCVDKIMEFKAQGKTIFFVSHSLAQVKKLCDRIIWMHYGELKMDGPSAEVAKAYDEYVKWFNGLTAAEKKKYQQDCKNKQKQPYLPLEVIKSGDTDSRSVRNQSKYAKIDKKGSVLTPFILIGLMIVMLVTGFSIATNQSVAALIIPSLKNETQENQAEKKMVWENVDEKARFNKSNVPLYSDEKLTKKVDAKVALGEDLKVLRQSGSTVEIAIAKDKFYTTKGNYQYRSDSIVQDSVDTSKLIPLIDNRIADSFEYFTAYLGSNKSKVLDAMNSLDHPKKKYVSLYEGSLKYHYDDSGQINSMEMASTQPITVKDLNISKSQTLYDEKEQSFFFEGNDYQYYVTKKTVTIHPK
ncbi:teichoic acids export ABC transporter ATP-binding subunit TagH [Brochothrix thermosphacta]|uniref:teichoic acids export ABC transporter ATP-binding subunit TagH n=1 Tax=Brochothrix thermosphacta TaxID=2756 RepID=UPI0003E8BB27|nr:teichoic acids export ABC transporter ATP-binding subunit TagH [Brochothrix thermosphacta]EUJ37964.1 teichoic acids export protein ATP-binding subunit [Brochothrix thermosphacta DSM 20171 = FSL F6-1036]ODJ48096.1 hypothetical protein BFR34_11300 [Brochothrix thermosphacta DSM 20171 = FSL F6-1036]ODJ59931.1 hypothetical protein BFR44_02470 [Brochothrix thermosphacta]